MRVKIVLCIFFLAVSKKVLFLTWGPKNCLMAIFREGPTWLKSWSTSSAHFRLQKSLNQTTNQFELRLHYTMSFAHKLTLMTFWMKLKNSSAARFEPETIGMRTRCCTTRPSAPVQVINDKSTIIYYL